MKNDTAEVTVNKLSELLDAERNALLKGDLEKVTELLEPKEVLFGQIDGEKKHDIRVLKALDDKVKRNQLLLNGALDGIRTVTDRMAALRRVQTSLDTYSADGRKKEIALRPSVSVERRA
jgi:hypothetical protein